MSAMNLYRKMNYLMFHLNNPKRRKCPRTKKSTVVFYLSEVSSKLQPMETNIQYPSSTLLVPHPTLSEIDNKISYHMQIIML